jgi:hypothetical protein
MAIKSFKEIIDNKGYRISTKDREIFEEGTLQSFFGFSDSDIIEFIAYDVNDNQLPLQINPEGDSVLAKYIPLTSENIKNYFMIAEGTLLQIGNFPTEYFIDVKRILNESGYDVGIFKTQVTLLNRRVGDYRKDINAKLWIKEISPSRTEIKVLPQRNSVADSTDLLVRYNIFYNDGDFRDDTLQYVSEFINKINPQTVSEYIRNVYSEKWLNKLIEEFNIPNIDTLITKIHSTFIKAVINEFQNKVSNINDDKFGKPKDTPIGIELSVTDIENRCMRILTQVIDKYLPVRKIQNTSVDLELDESFDRIETIMQRREGDTIVRPTIPKIPAKVEKEEPIEQVIKKRKQIEEIERVLGGERPDMPMDMEDDTSVQLGSDSISNSSSNVSNSGGSSNVLSGGSNVSNSGGSSNVRKRVKSSNVGGGNPSSRPTSNRPTNKAKKKKKVTPKIQFVKANSTKTAKLTNDNLSGGNLLMR